MMKDIANSVLSLRLSKTIFLLIFFILASISIYIGILQALEFSKDFPWSPTKLFLNGQNPYDVYLSGNLNNQIIYTQFPTYSHSTYIILSPLAMLDFQNAKIVWAIINIFIGISIPILLNKQLNLKTETLIIVILMFLAATPFRNSLANGNVSLLVLLALTFSLFSLKNFNLLSGLAFIKYSFVPPFLFSFLIQRRIKDLIMILIIPLFSFLVFILLMDGNPLKILVQPLIVASQVIGIESIGIMSITKLIVVNLDGSFDLEGFYSLIIYSLLPILFCFFIVLSTHRIFKDELFIFSSLCIASLISFTHLYHDFILYLPALMIAISHLKNIFSRILIFLIMTNWYGLTVIRLFGYIPDYTNVEFRFAFLVINLIVGLSVLLCLHKIYKQERT